MVKHPKKPKAPSKKKLRSIADKLFTEVVILSMGKLCEVCGYRNANTAHHFIPKSESGWLRYNLENGIPICMECHYQMHSARGPLLIGQIIGSRGLSWFDNLKKLKKEIHPSHKTVKFYKDNIQRLEMLKVELIKKNNS